MNVVVDNFDRIIEFAKQYALPTSKKRAVVREYLQVKILDMIYQEKTSLHLHFVGGTSLRLLRGLDRFSEDLDFDVAEISPREVNNILISSGLPRTPTPVGAFTINKKLPLVRYRGLNPDGTVAYDYPRTKWNMQFLPRYYIHGAYWHNNFGHPMSHGCINVAYKDMEQLYRFADMGTLIYIHE